MARLSNKFSNLLVLVLAVPAIIVALDADFGVTAAPFHRMQRRAAFLGAEDSILEARDHKTEFVARVAAEMASSALNSRAPLHDRDLSEISHELLGRDFTELEVELMRRTLSQPPAEGSSSVGTVDPAHSSPSTVAESVGSHTINEKHLGNCTHHHHHPVNGTHPHHLVNGTHPHHYRHCHNGTHEGSTAGVPGQTSLKAEPLTAPSIGTHPAGGVVSGAAKSQPSTVGHRRRLVQPPVEGSSDPAHSSPSTVAESVGSHTVNEKHLGNCTHHHHHHHPDNGTHPHHLVNGTHPHHYRHCHNGTHEGSTAGVPGQASLKAEPLTPPSSGTPPAAGAVSGAAKSQPSTAGHRRSFYYVLEDLD
jgi:hypothetical protein